MPMTSLLTTIREFLGPPDPRSTREIEDDIDAEFAFHIEQIERELIEQGVPPEHAADLARARFGNQHKLKQRCKRIALEERAMLQRINLGLMIVVLLTVAVVAVQSILSQRANHEALAAISKRLDQMSGVLTSAPPAARTARVLVEGEIEHPGWYPIDLDGATYLHEVLERAGGVEPHHEVRRVWRHDDGRRPSSSRFSYDDLFGEQSQRVVLRPNDEINVRASRQDEPDIHTRRPQPPQVGTWRQVNESGQPVSNGYTLSVVSGDDIRNLQSWSYSKLHLPDHDMELRVSFIEMGNELGITDDTGRYSRGRWQIDKGTLAINIAPAVEAISEPLYFRHATDLDSNEVAATSREAAEARILIDGDIERPGWYPIVLDELTYLRDLLERAGVHERQWVRLGGHGGPSIYSLAMIYMDDDGPGPVIRPGYSIRVTNDPSVVARCGFALRRADRFLVPYEWREVDDEGRIIDDGWTMSFSPSVDDPTKRSGSASLVNQRRSEAYRVDVSARRAGLLLRPSEEPSSYSHLTLNWSFDIESLTLNVTAGTGPRTTLTEEELQAVLGQIGLPNELTLERFPRQ
jgi:protein involved in polysaccharide export with SLBB domain